jgi:hypothetical protein
MRCMSVRLQESTVFQFHSICTRLLVKAYFDFGHISLSRLLTEILHGEVASFGSEVADAPAEVVIVISMLLISIIPHVALFLL